jgi:hypothetical protein
MKPQRRKNDLLNQQIVLSIAIMQLGLTAALLTHHTLRLSGNATPWTSTARALVIPRP